MENKIQHNQENNRFYIEINGSEAYLLYKYIEKNKIDVYKTFVPEELRGGRIASDLVESMLEFINNQNLEVLPSCSYVKKYISRK